MKTYIALLSISMMTILYSGCYSDSAKALASAESMTGRSLFSRFLINGEDNAFVLETSRYSKDNTAYLQKALNSEADVIVIPAEPGPWYTGPLTIDRDNLRVIFESGAKIEAREGEFRDTGDCLLTINNRKNIALLGHGTGEGLYMRRDDYQSSSYDVGEWRHCLSLLSTENIRVEGLVLARSGGDGIYLGQSKQEGQPNYNINTTITNCLIQDNHRQGISVISAENLLIEDCIVTGTRGTLPKAGIDFEPNRAAERLVNCRVMGCRFEDNAGPGILIFLRKFDETTIPLDITLENNYCRRNFLGIGIHLTRLSGNPPGRITLKDNDFGFSLFNRIPRNRSLEIVEK